MVGEFTISINKASFNGKHKIEGDYALLLGSYSHVFPNWVEAGQEQTSWTVTFKDETNMLNFFKNFIIKEGSVILVKESLNEALAALCSIDNICVIYPGSDFIIINVPDSNTELLFKLIV